jgi:predicted DNA-binding transcriptional regulator YafY
VLPARLRSRVSALQSAVLPVVPPGVARSQVDFEVLTAIAVACRDRYRLRFSYRSHDGSASSRDAEPYRLVNLGQRWYLVAFDVGRSDWRIFRVDRMSLRTPGGPRFAERALPASDLAAYVSRAVSSTVMRYRARVTVFAPASVVAARIGPWAGSLTEVSSSVCVLDTGSDDASTLAAYLGMIGYDFRVDSPPELVEAVRALADRYRRAVITRSLARSEGGGGLAVGGVERLDG